MKALWIILCIFLPFLALFLYLTIRRCRMKASRSCAAEMPNTEEETS